MVYRLLKDTRDWICAYFFYEKKGLIYEAFYAILSLLNN